jgi:acetate kinase
MPRLGLTGGPLSIEGLPQPAILTINGGSSSLKFADFVAACPIERALSGRVERVGLGEPRQTMIARKTIRLGVALP